jgi:hypothetical protein
MSASEADDNIPEGELEEFAQRVRERLAPCAYGQPYDEGEPVWINFHTPLDDVMEMVGVPDEYREEVADRVDCPTCHGRHELYEEVGYKADQEIRYDELIDKWVAEYQDQFHEFHRYLEKYPYLGLNHEFGRRIFEDVGKFPATQVSDELWYRARRIQDGRDLSPADFYPPDPNKIVIGEGRFNHHGQSLFYLARNEYAAALEVMREDENRAWVQGFLIKAVKPILDLTLEEQWAEEGWSAIAVGLMYVGALSKPVERERGWKPEYLVPRFVADCARAQGLNGIAFKGTRHFFDNLVLFGFDPESNLPDGKPRIVEVKEVYRRHHLGDSAMADDSAEM